MRNKKTLVAAAGLIASLLSGGTAATAHQRDFPFTYDWFQPSQNEKEVELHELYRPAYGALEQQIEFEYGITPRFMVAPYLVFEHEGDGGWHYDSVRIESRYQLGNFVAGHVLPGLYLEYEKPHDGQAELEGKVILSRYGASGDDISLNLIVEQSLRSGAPLRGNYSLGYSRPLGKNRYMTRGGLELVRNIDDGRVDAGPVIAFRPLQKIWVSAGFGFPLGHNKGGELRVLSEYEWF